MRCKSLTLLRSPSGEENWVVCGEYAVTDGLYGLCHYHMKMKQGLIEPLLTLNPDTHRIPVEVKEGTTIWKEIGEEH